MRHALAAAHRQLAQAHDLGGDLAHVVQRHRLGGVLQQVEHIVHRVDQAVDLLAIDRRDEGLVQQAVDLGRDLVGLAFGRVDLVGVLLAQHRVGVVADHRHERARALGDVRGMLVEQLEEIAFTRQQLAKQHGGLRSPVCARAPSVWRECMSPRLRAARQLATEWRRRTARGQHVGTATSRPTRLHWQGQCSSPDHRRRAGRSALPAPGPRCGHRPGATAVPIRPAAPARTRAARSRGCGTVRPGDRSRRSPKSSKSRSSVRGAWWYGRSRPARRSIACSCASSACGVSWVRNSATALT